MFSNKFHVTSSSFSTHSSIHVCTRRTLPQGSGSIIHHGSVRNGGSPSTEESIQHLHIFSSSLWSCAMWPNLRNWWYIWSMPCLVFSSLPTAWETLELHSRVGLRRSNRMKGDSRNVYLPLEHYNIVMDMSHDRPNHKALDYIIGQRMKMETEKGW